MTPWTQSEWAIARRVPITDRWANFVGTSLRPCPASELRGGWQPAAAKVLVTVLDTLRKSAQGRRGNLAVVRDMTAKGGAPGA
jgi:hypothetical protein